MNDTLVETVAQRLRWFARTDRGKVRANNEDSFMGLQFDAREMFHLGKIGDAPTHAMDFVFAVSDGMGGALAGEFASRIVVDKTATLLPRLFRQSASGLAPGFSDVLSELFERIHKALTYVGNSYDECRGMEATLSLCWFTPEWMYFGHIGDSRLYYLPVRSGEIKQLSQDDTHVGWLFRNGKINEREARTHPRRSVLQKALGGNNQFVDPQVGAVGYEPGDIFLLCTDGLTDGLYNSNIVDILRSSALNAPSALNASNWNPAEILVDESLSRSGRDNTTALVIYVE